MKTMKPIALAILAGALVAGAADARPRELASKASETLSRYEPSGESTFCVPLRSVDDIRGIDSRMLLVRTTTGRTYLNQTNGACNADRRDVRFEYTLSQSQLCSGQIVNVVDNFSGILVGVCSLGDFERVTEKPAES